MITTTFQGHRVHYVWKKDIHRLRHKSLPRPVTGVQISTRSYVSSAKNNFFDIASGRIYVMSKQNNKKTYWDLQHKRPKFKFLDDTYTIKINTYSVKFKRQIDYWSAKYLLHDTFDPDRV